MKLTYLGGLAAVAAFALGSLCAPATAVAPSGTLTMKSDANYSSVFPQGSAGEFQITSLTGDVAALATMDVSRRAGGSYFQTFCAQFSEDIFSNTVYTWTLDGNLNGDPATPLLNTSAFLYSGFWNGTLPGYSYTLGAPRSTSAKSLQLAIWYLQGQIQGNPTFLGYYNSDAQAQGWVAYAQLNAPAGIGNVRVMVVTEGTILRQDILTMVPPPPPPPGDSTGKTPGFWQNKNGQKLIDEGDLLALRLLNLVNGDGTAFDPTTKEQVGGWILSNATNMAYKLSSHLAAMTLNTRNGFVNPADLVYCDTAVDPSGKISIADLMSKANAELALHPVANTNAIKTYQEALKNALDKANNNQNWV